VTAYVSYKTDTVRMSHGIKAKGQDGFSGAISTLHEGILLQTGIG